jgi:hypothetical protein
LPYLHQEVNVETISLETDVSRYIRLEVLPNLPKLGPKFKGSKAFPAIRKAISELRTEEIEQIRLTGWAELAGSRISIVLLD